MKMADETVFKEKLNRIKQAVACGPVDQVPVIYMGVAFAPRFLGIPIAKFCTDPEVAINAQLETMEHFNGFDGCQLAGGYITYNLTALWMSKLKMPGRDLPEESLWQVEEKELLTRDDYDTILEKGWNAFLPNYLPRIVNPEEFFHAMAWNAQNAQRIYELYKEHGFVILADAPLALNIPFEPLCGARSMQQFILDLFEIPDKVEKVMEIMAEEALASIQNAPPPPADKGNGTWIGGWRTASAMLSPKLWNRFVWPYIVKYVNAVAEKGYTPILHWDHDWTRDLERLDELPAKKVVLNPDGMTDVRKFRKIVGDNMSLLGDVPATLFAIGTPDDIYNYVRDLVRDTGTTGLLLCPGCDAPINTKPENMAAFVAAGKEFGKIS